MSTTKLDYNSSANQEIKRQFVSREVYCNVYSLVEYCLQKGFEDLNSPISLDSIENYYSLPVDTIIDEVMREYGEHEDEFIEYANNPDTYNRRVKTRGDFEVFLHSLDSGELKEFCNDFNIDCESEPQEIYEWWAVSRNLYEDLKAKGEPVCDTGSTYVWGRTTTGQAILLDGIISEICADMEILQGMKNDWSKTA